jgi:hypothetical protein
VHNDYGLVTSRKPDDLPVFSAEMIDAVAKELPTFRASEAMARAGS